MSVLNLSDHEITEFMVRSKNRERQRRIIRELFQSRMMKTSLFKHANRLIDAEQRRDERTTGFRFTNIFDGSKANGMKSSPTFLDPGTDDRLSV